MSHDELLSKKRILIVDDEPDVLDILEQLLREDYEVVKASSFKEAKNKLEKQKFDIAILDIMGVDGYGLLSIAKEKGVLGVMLTAHALSPEDMVKAYREEAAAYLPKEKIGNIVLFLNDILEAKQKGRHLWSNWLKRLASYFDGKFGSEWKSMDPDLWEKYKWW